MGDLLKFRPTRFIKIFVRWKIYYDRARAYIGAIQFLMLAVILAKQFGIRLGVLGSCLLVLVFFLGCLVVGYVDTKLGIRKEEASNYNEQNPQITEILTILKSQFENNRSYSRTWANTTPEDNNSETVRP